MLLNNLYLFNRNCRTDVGTAVSNPFGSVNMTSVATFYVGSHVVSGETEKSAFYNGYVPPYSWFLSPKAGGLSSCNEVNGSATITGSVAKGINLSTSDLNGVGTFDNSSLSMVVSCASALVGTGALTASMVGSVSLAVTIAGEGNVTAALGLIANCVSTILGQGSVDATLRGTATLESDIYVNQSQAEVNALVAGIWNALAADYNESGTMGQKLNGAGSAGDPWGTDLSAYTTAGSAGKKLKDSLTIGQFIALK